MACADDYALCHFPALGHFPGDDQFQITLTKPDGKNESWPLAIARVLVEGISVRLS
jgi:hypothetical protein